MTHPEILVRQEWLGPNGLSVTKRPGATVRLSATFRMGGRAFRPRWCYALNKAFGASARFWMEQQMNHETITVGSK